MSPSELFLAANQVEQIRAELAKVERKITDMRHNSRCDRVASHVPPSRPLTVTTRGGFNISLRPLKVDFSTDGSDIIVTFWNEKYILPRALFEVRGGYKTIKCANIVHSERCENYAHDNDRAISGITYRRGVYNLFNPDDLVAALNTNYVSQHDIDEAGLRVVQALLCLQMMIRYGRKSKK